MNAHSFTTARKWSRTAAAQALLSSMRAKPPRMKRAPAPLAKWIAGSPEYTLVYDRNDERVDDLARLSNAAFLAAEAAGADTALLAASWPSVDDVIRAALTPELENV